MAGLVRDSGLVKSVELGRVWSGSVSLPSRSLLSFPFLAMTNQYIFLLAYVYWPTHIYLFKEQGQTPSATVAMMRPPATLQP